MKPKYFKSKEGSLSAFTIVELLIVIVIIGILAAITIISYSGITKKATETTFVSDLANAKKQFALYFAEHGVYPTELDSNKCLKNSSLTPQTDTNYCLKSGSGNNFALSDVTSTGYTLTATKGSVSYKITNDLPPTLVDLPIGQPLANWTWGQIAQASSSGTASTHFQVGNTKDITLSTGEVITMQIYGFNHDDKSDGTGKAGITFGTKNLMAAIKVMNSSATNAGGWQSTEMRSWVNSTLFNQFTNELKSKIKQVAKVSGTGGYLGLQTITNDSVFLFSEIEIYGHTICYGYPEGSQYQIFTDVNNTYKKLSNGSGAETWWWERTAPASNNSMFMVGGSSADYANHVQYGTAFGFAI